MISEHPSKDRMMSPQISLKTLAPILLLFVSLSVICPFPANAQVYRKSAWVLNPDCTILGDTVLLNVHIGYSYSIEQWLNVSVQTYAPEQYYEKTINVGPGTGVNTLDFELKPRPSTDKWLITITLGKSSEQGENLGIVYSTNVEIDIKGAEERQNQPNFATLIILVSAVLLAATFFFSRERNRGKKAELNRKNRQRHHREHRNLVSFRI